MLDLLIKALDDLEKAAQHKYTHKRRIGTDSRGRPKWRYYYNRKHGGGIGLRALEVQKGEAFGLTYGGKRGHFHVQKVKGNFVTVRHDESGHEVRMTKKELQALIISQREEKQPAEKKPAEKKQAEKQTAKKTPAEKQTAKKTPAEKRKRKRSPRLQVLVEKLDREISDNIEPVGRLHADIDETGIITSVDRGETNAHLLAAGAVKRALDASRDDYTSKKDYLVPSYVIFGSETDQLKNKTIQGVLDAYQPKKTEQQAQLELKIAVAKKALEILPRGIESLRDKPDYIRGEIKGKNQRIRERIRALEALITDTQEELVNITQTSKQLNSREQLTETAREATQSADNFETMPESEPTPSRAGMAPSLGEMSIEELHSERTSARAEVDDLETLIEERRRRRQPISEQRKIQRQAQSNLSSIEEEIQKRERQKIPSQTEIQAAVEKVRQMIEINPALAKMPEVAALLGSTGPKKAEVGNLPDSELIITLQGKTQNVPVRYKIIEAGDATASHDAGGFFRRPDYPTGVQEREYHDPRGPEQQKVIVQAQNLNPQLLINTNPDAMNGPPILTAEGIALGGNSRVMSVQRAYMAHPKKADAYKDYLRRKAHQFGLSVEDVDQFSAPLLVREYVVEDQSKENLSKLVRAMNEGLTQEFDPQGEGRAAATKLQGENVTLSAIASALRSAPEGSTLNSVLKTQGSRLESIKRALFRDGILTSRNSNRFIHQGTGQFNDQGVSFIQRMITGYVIRDDRLMRALSPSTEDAIGTALAKLAAVGIRADDATKIQDAILLYNGLLSKPTDNGGIHYSMKPQARDRRMNVFMNEDVEMDFGEGGDKINLQRVKNRVKKDPLASAFLKILTLSPRVSRLNSAMSQFVSLVQQDSMDMFSPEPIDFTGAANQIAQDLAREYDIPEGLYKSRYAASFRNALYTALARV